MSHENQIGMNPSFEGIQINTERPKTAAERGKEIFGELSNINGEQAVFISTIETPDAIFTIRRIRDDKSNPTELHIEKDTPQGNGKSIYHLDQQGMKCIKNSWLGRAVTRVDFTLLLGTEEEILQTRVDQAERLRNQIIQEPKPQLPTKPSTKLT